MNKIIFILIFMLITIFCFSDIIKLNDGTVIIGKFSSIQDDSYIIITTDGEIKLKKTDVLTIELDDKIKNNKILDTTIDQSKRLEFTFGASFSNPINLKSESYKLIKKFSYNPDYIIFSGIINSSRDYNFSGLDFNLSLPFCFIYYPKKSIGIGFKVSNGINFVLDFFYLHLNYIDITSNIYFVNKINGNNKKSLLIEYGLVTAFQIFITNYSSTFSSSAGLANEGEDRFYYDNIKYKFLFGPGLFLGTELKSKNNFSVTIGCIFESLFFINPVYNNEYSYVDEGWFKGNIKSYISYSWSNYYISFIKIGMEIRLNYYYNKRLK